MVRHHRHKHHSREYPVQISEHSKIARHYDHGKTKPHTYHSSRYNTKEYRACHNAECRLRVLFLATKFIGLPQFTQAQTNFIAARSQLADRQIYTFQPAVRDKDEMALTWVTDLDLTDLAPRTTPDGSPFYDHTVLSGRVSKNPDAHRHLPGFTQPIDVYGGVRSHLGPGDDMVLIRTFVRPYFLLGGQHVSAFGNVLLIDGGAVAPTEIKLTEKTIGGTTWFAVQGFEEPIYYLQFETVQIISSNCKIVVERSAKTTIIVGDNIDVVVVSSPDPIPGLAHKVHLVAKDDVRLTYIQKGEEGNKDNEAAITVTDTLLKSSAWEVKWPVIMKRLTVHLGRWTNTKVKVESALSGELRFKCKIDSIASLTFGSNVFDVQRFYLAISGNPKTTVSFETNPGVQSTKTKTGISGPTGSNWEAAVTDIPEGNIGYPSNIKTGAFIATKKFWRRNL
eukprot:CAMPEP_0175119368 /NCGR_PEP_ID=MMETSP0087-20121206/18_1 /TAXON_ID=136419 /ORGANISM="Unknown Unknown, Strain D1" /LENGTH=449 /DNA_ID=CAMNT_0016400679 /DNA_START=1474 /DNA_END=2823 /DNA_ORIENTATION=+